MEVVIMKLIKKGFFFLSSALVLTALVSCSNKDDKKKDETTTSDVTPTSTSTDDFDNELANNDSSTIKITQSTLKVPASFPNNEEQQTQQLDIKPNSTYSDFFDEHGNSGSYTYGVDQNILSDLKSGNVGLYNYSLSDILYDPSIEEKSLAEFLQENGNLSTAEQGQAVGGRHHHHRWQARRQGSF